MGRHHAAAHAALPALLRERGGGNQVPVLALGLLHSRHRGRHHRPDGAHFRPGRAGRQLPHAKAEEADDDRQGVEDLLGGLQELPHVDCRAALRLLLRRRAHHQQHHRKLLLRPLRAGPDRLRRYSLVLRHDEPVRALSGRHPLRHLSALLWHARPPMGALLDAGSRRHLLRRAGRHGHPGIVPFISRRALGVVAGFVGAGGNAGSSITQAAFFTPDSLTTAEGIKWMGVTIVGVSFFTVFIHFPQWGSMFFPGNPTTSEEDYYGSEYNETEKMSGLADNSMKFAASSGAERGSVFEKSRSEKLEKIMSSQSARSAQC